MKYFSNYWYVLFVRTGREEKALNEVKDAFQNDEVTSFVPRKENLFRKQGIVIKETHIMFPGYIFIETPLNGNEFSNLLKIRIPKSDSIIRILSDPNKVGLSVPDEERKFFNDLWGNQNHCVEVSSGIIKGEHVIITEGALVGQEGIIKMINRHKLQASIELELFGDIRQVKVGLEIIKKSSKY